MHEIAGYRIVRRLSSTHREERAVGRGHDGGVLVRRLREPLPSAVERAVEAHAAAGQRPHIASVRDLAIEPDGSLVVVTDLVTGPSIRALMSACHWQLGHAVTLLVPLLRTLAGLHEAGVTLGRLDPGSLRVDATGAPMIVDWSDAVATPPLPVRLRERDAHYVADAAAVDQLVAEIAATLSAAEGALLRDAIADAPHGADMTEVTESRWSTVADRVLSLADPQPLLPSDPSPRPDPATPFLALGSSTALDSSPPPVTHGVGPVPRGASRNDAPLSGALQRVSGAVGLPPALVSALGEAVSDAGDRIRRIRAYAAGLSRRRLLLTAGAVALGLAICVTSVLDRGDGHDAVTVAESAGGGDATGENAGAEPPLAGEAATGASAAEGGAVPEKSVLELPDPQDGDWPRIVQVLVTEWQRCARSRERLCDTALHRESAAADRRLHSADDQDLAHLVAMVEATPEVLITERMGAAVILDVSAAQMPAASLLLMRSEAGWRVRDVLG